MARRRPTTAGAGSCSASDPHWRYAWLQRATLMSDLRIRELVSSESKRLAPLPIEEQVARMESFLDRHVLLDRANGLINHLVEFRLRWREQINSKGRTR